VELITGRALFQTHENLEHLAMIERVVTPIPADMVKRASKDAQRYFSSSRGSLMWEATATRRSVKMVQQLASLRRLLREEADESVHPHLNTLHTMLANMLSLWPGQRMSARQCLQADFFSENIRSLLPKMERQQDNGKCDRPVSKPTNVQPKAATLAPPAAPLAVKATLDKRPNSAHPPAVEASAPVVTLRLQDASEPAGADASVTGPAAELAGREPLERAQRDAGNVRDEQPPPLDLERRNPLGDGGASAGDVFSSRDGSPGLMRTKDTETKPSAGADDVQRSVNANGAGPAADAVPADHARRDGSHCGDDLQAGTHMDEARLKTHSGSGSTTVQHERVVTEAQVAAREHVCTAARVLRSCNKGAVVREAAVAKVPAMLVLDYGCATEGMPHKSATVVDDEAHPSDYAEDLAFDHSWEANA
jgi:hypothetical protein